MELLKLAGPKLLSMGIERLFKKDRQCITNDQIEELIEAIEDFKKEKSGGCVLISDRARSILDKI